MGIKPRNTRSERVELLEVRQCDERTFEATLRWRGRTSVHTFVSDFQELSGVGFYLVKPTLDFERYFADYEVPGEDHRGSPDSSLVSRNVCGLIGQLLRGRPIRLPCWVG